jgi:hypothetical protein
MVNLGCLTSLHVICDARDSMEHDHILKQSPFVQMHIVLCLQSKSPVALSGVEILSYEFIFLVSEMVV